MGPEVVLLGSWLGGALAITCYHCPQAMVVNSTCLDGADQTAWCGDGQWCEKSWNNQNAVSWGCAQEPPAGGYETCTSEQRDSNSSQTVCYCSSNLCNSAPHLVPPLVLGFLVAGLLLMLG